MSQALKELAFKEHPELLDDNRSPDPDYDRWSDNLYQEAIQELNMNVNELFPSTSQYLKAADLAGKARMMTIAGIRVDEFEQDGKQVRKPVVTFQGTDRELVLNKTNGQAIAAMHGDDTDKWEGKQIKIFPTKVDFGGSLVAAIRVQIEMEVDDTEIPF